jgi:hypothetical protein
MLFAINEKTTRNKHVKTAKKGRIHEAIIIPIQWFQEVWRRYHTLPG